MPSTLDSDASRGRPNYGTQAGSGSCSRAGRRLRGLRRRQHEVFDVTGAGDTVIAVLTLGMIAGLSTRRSAELASAAACVVVRRLGVAVATPDEIVEVLRHA